MCYMYVWIPVHYCDILDTAVHYQKRTRYSMDISVHSVDIADDLLTTLTQETTPLTD